MDEYTQTFERRGESYNSAHEICPGGREAERALVIDRLAASPGERVLDAPAGGGYLADGLRARGLAAEDIVCQEPSANFASALDPAYPQVRAPIYDAQAHAAGSLDAVASLAGVHHVQDKRLIYRAWWGALRPGGRLVMADVQAETGVARFLNGFVDAHVPGGHEGIFLVPGEVENEMQTQGFQAVSGELCKVPWHFPDMQTCAAFCLRLFGLQGIDEAEVGKALAREVGITENADDSVDLHWQLYCVQAKKPE